ncbi:MAG: septation protein A [Alphaproteobacteria bacterium]|nr:MAG: septation protein A [Alphaproteobacteria bacterium]
MPASAWRKLLIEMGPLLLFFLVNWKAGIFYATGAFMAAVATAMLYSWVTVRHIPPMLWVTGVVVMAFGGLTIVLQDELFIKLKPTVVNLIFASVLFFGLKTDRPILKMLFEAAFPPISDAGWRRLTVNWALFFLFLAALNETVWRTMPTDFWVAFKVWGVMPLTFLFSLTQVPVMMKHMVEEEEKAG